MFGEFCLHQAQKSKRQLAVLAMTLRSHSVYCATLSYVTRNNATCFQERNHYEKLEALSIGAPNRRRAGVVSGSLRARTEIAGANVPAVRPRFPPDHGERRIQGDYRQSGRSYSERARE